MGQLRVSQNLVFTVGDHRIAKNNKICPNTEFLLSILNEISPRDINGMDDVIHRGNAYRGFFHVCVISDAENATLKDCQ